VSDPIVDEVRAFRDAVARGYGYDVKKPADALREQQETRCRKVIRHGWLPT
jgi:hypothetical protein